MDTAVGVPYYMPSGVLWSGEKVLGNREDYS